MKSDIDIQPRRAQLTSRPTAERRDPHLNAGGSTGPRRDQRGTWPPREECEEPAVKSKSSDNEDSVAQTGHNRSKRLEDQMAKMAKELEELKKEK